MTPIKSHHSRLSVIPWLLFFLLCSQILAPAALAQSTKPKQSAEDYFAEGEKLLNAAQYEDAIDAYTQAIKLYPEYAEAYQQRGEAYRMVSEYKQAVKDLNRAIKLDPDVYLPYATRGATLKELGQYEDALDDFNQALDLEKDSVFALANRGHTYYYLGEYDAALEDLDRALTLNPEYTWALVVRGQTYQGMENYEKALLDLTRAIALDSKYDWAYVTRGETHRLMGNSEEALADLDQAIELNGDYTYALAVRGKTYEDLARYDEALADFDRALELDPEYAWVLAERGYVYQATERYEEALADFDRALKLDDTNDWAYAQRGLTYQAMEEYKKALADFNDALDLSPEKAWHWTLRADLYRIMERYDDALADSDKAIDLDPEYDFAWGVRGYIYRQTEQYEEAIDAFSHAIELSPDYTWAYTMRGEVYQLMGRDKEALADFNQATALNGGEPVTDPKLTQEETDKTATQNKDLPAVKSMSSRAEAAQAIIRIETVGSFVAPDKEQRNLQAGSGSGFIIDPSGIAVTNNHVVTGAALLKVYVPGYNRVLNARVLGVSECADLAVIDIEGDGYPYLSWHEAEIAVGLDVFAAGYPLGDPEFTLTRGIVSKERANGQTRWSSLESVLQHDATINPGNSGGPLIDDNGQVVGVNYAGNSEFNQYFAIPGSVALPLIEQLRQGVDIDALGINGEAMSNGEDFSGIWVYSVKSGSLADQAGIQGGDFILTMEKLPMAADGTMRTYCDVVRSHNAEDTLNVEVLRMASNEMCTGQINGRPLACVATKNAPSTDNGETQEVDLQQVQHEDGQFTLSVPSEWSELTSSTGDNHAQLIASSKSGSTGTVVTVFLNQQADPDNFDQALDEMRKGLEDDSESLLEGCKYGKRDSFTGEKFQGAFDQWSDCGSEKNAVFTIILMPTNNQAFFASFIILWPANWELTYLDQMLDSLAVNLEAAPSTTTTSEQQTAQTVVVVETKILNVRSGPGTNYGVLGQLEQGARLAAVAQAYNCTWLQVQLPNGNLGWVAGKAPYTSLEGNCADLPQGKIPAASAGGGNGGSNGGSNGGNSGGGTGCIFFQNHFNDEATVTLNKKDGSWNKTFKIGRKANHRECLVPGDYTYTVDVPPPWDSINGNLTIVRGQTIDFPIYGEQ